MKDIKKMIEEFCIDEGLDYRENYSGRGMFGRNCVAISCDNPLSVLSKLFAFLVDYIGEVDIGQEIYSILGEPKQDSMGMHNILYFPKLRTS